MTDRYRGIQAVVLGASGFIGRWVARGLTAAGANLTLVVRDRAHSEAVFHAFGVHGNILEADLEDFIQVNHFLSMTRPAVIFNLAGYGVDRNERHDATAFRINAELIEVLIEGLRKCRDRSWSGCNLVNAGSALEYGEIVGDLAEDSIPRPTTLYGRSKLTGTQTVTDGCEDDTVRGLTARLFTVYGPGEHAGRLLPSLIETARTGAPLELTDGAQRRDFTYVADAAEGLLRLGTVPDPAGKVVNLATGKLTPVRHFIETAADIMGIPAKSLLFGAIPTRSEEMSHDPVNIGRLTRMTGWIPGTTIEEGIRRTWQHHLKMRPPRASETNYSKQIRTDGSL